MRSETFSGRAERKMSGIYPLLLLVGWLALLAPAAAAVTFPEAFPQSTREVATTIESGGHLLLFSPAREINNAVRADVMARLPVSGEGRLYLLDRDASRRQARDHYRRWLQDQGARVLFECEGIRCGRSVVWANRVFGQAVLNGRDSDQDYLVALSQTDQGERWLTLVYTVTRGNRREYVWVEHLQVGADATIPGAEAGGKQIAGPWVVPWQGGVTYRFDWQVTDRRRIRTLAGEPGSLVVLAGFSELAAGESYEDSLTRAQAALESMSEVLARIGIPRDRQRLVVAGPGIVIPDPERQGDRIEITVIRRTR